MSPSDMYRICLVSLFVLMCTLLITNVQAQASNKLSAALQGGDEGSLMDSDEMRADSYNALGRLQEEEKRLIRLIKGLDTQVADIRTQKRAHVQCLVNLVACYRKRK